MCLPAGLPSVPAMDDAPRRPLGLPLLAVLGLALLAVPRVVLHDLGLLTPGSVPNALLVFVPPAVWVLVAVLGRVPDPLRTLLAVGAGYGVFLALVHQLLWPADLPPEVDELLARGAAVLSSLVTGALTGLAAGAVAWVVGRAVRRRVS
jgi:hypothetical protein